MGPGYRVDRAPAGGRDHEQIGLVGQRRQGLGRSAGRKLWLASVPCVHQHHLARAVEFMGPGWRCNLIRDDGRRADETHRGRHVTRKLEARNRQLQIGIRKVHDGFETTASTTARRPASAGVDSADRPRG